VIEAIEPRTVEALVDLEKRFQFGIISNLPLFIFLVLSDNLILLAGNPLLEVLDVGRIMEEAQLILIGLLALKHHEVVAEFIALDEGMSHLDAFGLHGMLLAEVVVGNGIVIEVAYFAHIHFKL
jgi:hypothetical protein